MPPRAPISTAETLRFSEKTNRRELWTRVIPQRRIAGWFVPALLAQILPQPEETCAS